MQAYSCDDYLWVGCLLNMPHRVGCVDFRLDGNDEGRITNIGINHIGSHILEAVECVKKPSIQAQQKDCTPSDQLGMK